MFFVVFVVWMMDYSFVGGFCEGWGIMFGYQFEGVREYVWVLVKIIQVYEGIVMSIKLSDLWCKGIKLGNDLSYC